MSDIIQVAKQAARRAGKFIGDSFYQRDNFEVEEKSLHDYVSEVDRTSETMLTEDVLKSFPTHQIIGEEFGRSGAQAADYQWVIDPLDGTTNFVRGIPHFAVSIGILFRGTPYAAVVFDPIKNEMFVAQQEQGTTLNGKPVTVAKRLGLRGGLLATGIPFSGQPLEELERFLSTLNQLLETQTSGVRRLGAAALDLAYVAAGRYDGFWESHLKLWDIAAGVLLVTEAGGVISDLSGGVGYLESGDVLAGSPNVHREMLLVTQSCYG
ncbi:inositol monophosphatase family protein [Arenicella xantha]|uniref:Inositol-1-monophosphatase n=1 Tax=Arenicella xantha TaxID=644221 RepID=A0A395JMM1_9GAMM|nr:inositol monophosphatase family protein [Arenicella xantha]RBP50888.1 myo-inositol-1(or 4)-monophosphatase [Arenicella xantha]